MKVTQYKNIFEMCRMLDVHVMASPIEKRKLSSCCLITFHLSLLLCEFVFLSLLSGDSGTMRFANFSQHYVGLCVDWFWGKFVKSTGHGVLTLKGTDLLGRLLAEIKNYFWFWRINFLWKQIPCYFIDTPSPPTPHTHTFIHNFFSDMNW